MKKGLLIVLLVGVLLNANTQKLHSFHPSQVWKDNNGVAINAHGGGILFFKGVYYWFGEHKIEGKIGNTAQVGVHCYSSTDLYNWKDEGIALKVSDDTMSLIRKGCIIERPKVVYNKKTKKFVMWFHHELKGKGYSYARAGVATASNICGPYTYQKSIRVNQGIWPVDVQTFHKNAIADSVLKKYYPGGGFPTHTDSLNLLGKFFHEGQMSRDMTIFVDDDAKAYHIYASEYNATIQIAELTNDYQSHSGKYVRAFKHRFMEAPAVFKKDGLYYLIMSGTTGWEPNAARAAVAPSVWGPWTEIGNPCIGADSALTFHSQSTYILPVQGKKNAFIFMADRWNANNPIDGRYVWLPIEFVDGQLTLSWNNEWNLSVFNRQ